MEEKQRRPDSGAACEAEPAAEGQPAGPEETEEAVEELLDALNRVSAQKEEKKGSLPEPEKEPGDAGPSEAEGGAPAGEEAPAAEDEPSEPDEAEEEERSEAERRRVADMTRTVQVSIEQILARAAEQEAAQAAAGEAAEEPEPEEDHHTETLGERIAGGVVSMFKWILLVVFLVLVIAGAGVAWLYRGATPDALPQISVTVAGQALEATAYNWKVPVVGNMIRRTYAETLNTGVYTLPETLRTVQPGINIQPSGLETALTVTDAAGEELFTGTVEEFRTAGLPGNGDYRAKLILTKPADRFGDGTSVSGTQTYLFAFTVGVQPSVRLGTQSALQGSIVALQVTNVPEGDVPELESEFADVEFHKGGSGWIAYLPIPYDARPGSSVLHLTVGSYTEEIDLGVRGAAWTDRDVSSRSQLVSPYLGQEDTPAAVKALLDVSDAGCGWAQGGFVQPFIDSITVTLPYGTTEYVGRTSSQIANGSGTGRTAVNAVVKTKWGGSLIAPAGGRVLLAEDLGGDAGKTVVIEHGAGLKSIFYNLAEITVEKGDTVVQGQLLGKAAGTVIAEVRVGTVPVEPFAVWRNQCDALKIN